VKKKITVLGGGAWGTAIAQLLASNGNKVCLWCFEKEVIDSIAHHRANPCYLPGVTLDEKISPTSNIGDALEQADIVFVVIPVLFLREVLFRAKNSFNNKQIWVLLSKGIEDKTLLLPSQVLYEVMGCEKMVVLSGPNFASQIAGREISGADIASNKIALAKKIASFCDNDYFVSNLSNDLIGTQVGGAIKNVLLIFLGILKGAGYKENTLAYFSKCALDELVSLIDILGGKKKTAYGLSGVGDIFLGLIGHSRNFELGISIGQGSSLKDLSKSLSVLPEGVNTTKAIFHLCAEKKINLPLCCSTYRILFESVSVDNVLSELI
jgi:glycerol-3-phosphate dehydrogenase (NAD(P)+)